LSTWWEIVEKFNAEPIIATPEPQHAVAPTSVDPEPAPATGAVLLPGTCISPTWGAESLESEAKFGAPHARLFPFLGRKVRTPQGPGVLLQVLRERCAIALDAEAQKYMHFFPPSEVEPISWMVGNEDLSQRRGKQ